MKFIGGYNLKLYLFGQDHRNKSQIKYVFRKIRTYANKNLCDFEVHVNKNSCDLQILYTISIELELH